MITFEILEHTADVGVRAFGTTLPELFENAALGLESLALDTERVEPRIAYPIAADGYDVESLLVNWLNEVIYHLDAKRVAFARLVVQIKGETAISGQGWGEPRHPEKHPPRLVVKAATYHQIRVAQEQDRWVAEVYLDI
jgi:SHS2 domain-containing protein